MPPCLEAVDFERLERGSLDEATLLEFRAHLSTCDRCRTAGEQFHQDQQFLSGVRSALVGATESAAKQADTADVPPRRPGRVAPSSSE